MQQNNNSKEKKDSTQLIQPKISEQINTPEHSLIKISLGKNPVSPGIIKKNKPKQVSKMYSQNISPTEKKISTTEIQLNNSNKISENDSNIYKEGAWTNEEHEKFIEGLLKYGNQWKNIQFLIQTRTSTQIGSHAQKFIKKIKNLIKKQKENIDNNEKIKLINTIFNIILPNKINKFNKEEKKKLLNIIFSNINSDAKLDLKWISEVNLDELENLEIENNVTNQNNNINLNLFTSNWKKKLNKKNALIGEKRKLDEALESKDIISSCKREETARSSFDLYFSKINSLDNIDYLNEYEGIYENDIIIQRNDNNNNTKNIYENNNITNNFINITKNIINNKIVNNIFNQDMFNSNSYQDLYNNDKNDSIHNENMQNLFGNSQTQEKCNFNDKSFLNRFKFNQINWGVDDENENENNNEIDPFKIDFKDLLNEKLFNNENERQMSIHEYNYV